MGHWLAGRMLDEGGSLAEGVWLGAWAAAAAAPPVADKRQTRSGSNLPHVRPHVWISERLLTKTVLGAGVGPAAGGAGVL